MKKWIVAGALLTSMNAYAQQDSELQFNVFGGLTYGGDKLVEVQYDNGDDDDVRAGGLYLLGAGLRYQPQGTDFGLQTSIAYHADSADASNDDTTFSRIVFEAVPFYRFAPQHRIGLGLALHTNVEFEIDFNRTETVEFDSALGLVLEYGYDFTGHDGTLAFRYTHISYDPSSYNGIDISSTDDIDGNHVGVIYYYNF